MAASSTLISTMGGQAQVVTFALDDLLARGERVEETVVVHLAPVDGRLQRAVAQLAAEFADGRYRGRPCRLHRIVIHNGPTAVARISDEAAAEATWQTVHRLIGQLKAEGRRLHLCVAGGPRMIGLMAMSAATLHFDHQDRLWHLYTPPEVLERARDGALLHVGPQDGVRLIQVPLVPWGAYFPTLRRLAQASSGEVIAAQTAWLDGTERTCCETVIERLTPRQLEALRAFAEGLTPQEVAERMVVTVKTVDAYKTVILGECRNAWGLPEREYLNYHFLREKFGRYFQMLESQERDQKALKTSRRFRRGPAM